MAIALLLLPVRVAGLAALRASTLGVNVGRSLFTRGAHTTATAIRVGGHGARATGRAGRVGGRFFKNHPQYIPGVVLAAQIGDVFGDERAISDRASDLFARKAMRFSGGRMKIDGTNITDRLTELVDRGEVADAFGEHEGIVEAELDGAVAIAANRINAEGMQDSAAGARRILREEITAAGRRIQERI